LLKSLYEYAKKDLLYHNRTSNISDLYDMALPVGATISGLSSDLRYAPEQNQIEPYFKPIIELKTGKLVGFDVLPVWLHPDYGVIASELLMPLADYIEQTALIGRIIYIKSVERLQYWQNHHLDYQNIFIRLQVTKSSLLGQYSVYEDLMSLRQKMNFSCASIHISFGIDCIHDDTTWIKDIIRDFKLASFITVLDDFGKSNSNLSTISDLPFDRVTLGAGYADNILKNERKYFTLRALMKMLHDLNIAVDIKNINDISGVAVLKKLGISHISGTVSGGAISAGNVTALLKHNKTQTIK
jgi:EAL domain-containing protein (putative c-di-GMP-specific phosphodiesterase class I)